MDKQLAAVMMLMSAKSSGTSYKKFAEEAGINLRKLYDCSTPGRCSRMTDEMVQTILDTMQKLHPANYEEVMACWIANQKNVRCVKSAGTGEKRSGERGILQNPPPPQEETKWVCI